MNAQLQDIYMFTVLTAISDACLTIIIRIIVKVGLGNWLPTIAFDFILKHFPHIHFNNTLFMPY